MKLPRPPGEPVDMPRMRGWLTDFANYRHTITEQRIDRWLSQFDLPDIDLAARILDCVDFVANEKIAASFRTSLESIPGWHDDPARLEGQWRFAAFSASAGESGDVMLHRFRHANNLASRKFNPLFVHRSELLTSGLHEGDTIVLVDDFSGTGSQATDAWPMLLELLPEGPQVYLLLVAATRPALDKIPQETELLVQADIVLEDDDGVFNEACDRFTNEEKETLRRYCRIAGSRSASQFAEAGYLLVFAHTCPNNTLPILHARSAYWEGLFRRYD